MRAEPVAECDEVSAAALGEGVEEFDRGRESSSADHRRQARALSYRRYFGAINGTGFGFSRTHRTAYSDSIE